MAKIIRYFPDTNISNSHKGLSSIAEKVGIDTTQLGAGEYLIFVNRAQNAVKMFAQGNVLAYLRVKGKLDLRTIAKLPTYFDGGEIRYQTALREVLEEDFKS